jgi:transposase-like protein
MIVMGVRDDGYREILGARIADGEDELFWSGLFQDLADRGLSGVKLVISDGHKGIQKAVEKSFLAPHGRYRRLKSARVSTSSKHVSCTSDASSSEERRQEASRSRGDS